jgi:hypothetical protein
MFKRRTIRLWWHLNNGVNNFGDILNPYLVKMISGREPVRTEINRFGLRPVYLVIGSVLNIANRNTIVWGSGIITRDAVFSDSKFLAVRGPISGKRIEELGFRNPKIYGDPALLLPKYYLAKVQKKYKLGIIPHIVDFEKVKGQVKDPDIKIISLDNRDVTEVIDQINSCEVTISSSLHGIIVSHAYGIPSLWVKFSDGLYGDGVKFEDYFLSVGISNYSPIDYRLEIPALGDILDLFPDHKDVATIKNDLNLMTKKLLEVCPFKNS